MEIFENVFPWYLSIGMPADQFWKGPPSWAAAYRKAEEYRLQKQNLEAWRMGIYVQSALQSTVGNTHRKKGAKPFKYMEEPLPMNEKEVLARKERDQKAVEERIKAKMREQMRQQEVKKRGGRSTN